MVSKRTMIAWENGTLQDAIIGVLQDDYLNNGGRKVMQFLNCANIPADISDPAAVITTILEVMRFPIKATNDAIARLGGNPYNNKSPQRQYSGSDNDIKLNLTVERIKKSNWETAAQNVADSFETSGVIQIPLVTMHTQYDPIALYVQETLYTAKVNANSLVPALLTHIPVPGRYGHCNFTTTELMAAIGSLFP